jgi:hypothetical protein
MVLKCFANVPESVTHFKGHFLPVFLLFARLCQVVVSYTYHMMMLIFKGIVPKDLTHSFFLNHYPHSLAIAFFVTLKFD